MSFSSKDFNASEPRRKISSSRHRHHINTEKIYFCFDTLFLVLDMAKEYEPKANTHNIFFRCKRFEDFFIVVRKVGQFKSN